MLLLYTLKCCLLYCFNTLSNAFTYFINSFLPDTARPLIVDFKFYNKRSFRQLQFYEFCSNLESILCSETHYIFSCHYYNEPYYDFAFFLDITSKATAMRRTNPLIVICISLPTPRIDIPLLSTPITSAPMIPPAMVPIPP